MSATRDVSIIHPGNRVDKMAVPLQASDLNVAVDPPNPYDADLVIADNADRALGKEVLKKPLHGARLIYRMRGDVFHELDLWDMHPVKRWAAESVVLTRVDGVLAVTDRLGKRFVTETGADPATVGTAELWVRPDEWPTADHTDTRLRCLTLTNANYWQKVAPLVEYAPVVDAVLSALGGEWVIGAGGEHEARLRDALEPYDHVTYDGYIDAQAHAGRANVMLHLSALDGQPNSILEGMASRLPVVTNDFAAFTDFDGPAITVDSAGDLRETLRRLVDPAVRATWGACGLDYVRQCHSVDAIARQYEDYHARLTNGRQN